MEPIGEFTLLAGEVHVWKVALASGDSAVGKLRGMLSEDERERAGRYVFEKDRARFISCRASLRMLLGRYAGVAPEGIVFGYGAQGKPALEGIAGWQFNVSHSRDLAAIAISRDEAVGVDLEFIDRDFPRDEVAPDVFTPDELRDLAAMPADGRVEYFFRLWTLKEALLKAVGSGFSVDPRSIRIGMDEGLKPVIVSAPEEFVGLGLRRVALEERFAGAVAVVGGGLEVGVFRFEREGWS